jgi:hypothetical protein
VVIPVGRTPTDTVSLPVTFTSDGCTFTEKLLPAKTVVGDGVAQIANTVGLVVGYGNEFEMIGTKPTLGMYATFAAVNDRAPGWLMKPKGRVL